MWAGTSADSSSLVAWFRVVVNNRAFLSFPTSLSITKKKETNFFVGLPLFHLIFYVQIFAITRTHTHTHTHVFVFVFVCVRALVFVCVHAYVCTNVCICACVSACARTHTHTLSLSLSHTTFSCFFGCVQSLRMITTHARA